MEATNITTNDFRFRINQHRNDIKDKKVICGHTYLCLCYDFRRKNYIFPFYKLDIDHSSHPDYTWTYTTSLIILYLNIYNH